MYIDTWRDSSVPISIPRPINAALNQHKIVIGTPSTDYLVELESGSAEILVGKMVSTPPGYKHFRKGDKVIFSQG